MAKTAIGSPVYLEGEIRERKMIGSLYHRMRISLPFPIGPIIPGQFAMLRVENGDGILLPRPFSIHNFEARGGTSWLDFLFKVVGKGTALLATVSVGSPVMVLAPLGTGFPDPPSRCRALLIAGGMGIAALYPLTLKLEKSVSPVCLFYGAKSRDDLLCLSELLALEGITIKIATEDGTAGKRGMVTELPKDEDNKRGDQTVIYACGPEPMLKVVTTLAAARKRPCWISLERRMACGVGACLGCVVRTKGGYKRVCKEGPVFSAQEIVWEEDA